MTTENTIESSSSENCELKKSQLDWLDDDLMMSEVRKLSSELKSRKVLLNKEELDLCVTTEPTVKSDYHKEIKDGVKEVEIDGKKYRQKYQRHIQLEKHTVKQIFTFSGDEASFLDFDVHSNSCNSSPKIENEIFFNLNTKTILEDIKRVVSPKIVIRSTNQISPKQEDSKNQFQCEALTDNKEINSYIDKFGKTDFSYLSLNKKTSKDLRNSFISQWQKTETQSQPQAKCKTISCVERFRALSNQGKLLHQSTCVQMTRSLIVRSKSGEDEIKSNQEIVYSPNVTEIPELFKINVSNHLVYNDKYNPSTEDTGKQLSIAAGHVDTLIVHACSIGISTTKDYHLFHKVFVVTYPLFISTEEILEKLVKRYLYFHENLPTQKDIFENDIDYPADYVQVEILSAIINLLVHLINHWSRPITEAVNNILSSFCENLIKTNNIKHNLLIQSALRDLDNRIIIKKNRKSFLHTHQMNFANNNIICRESVKTILDFDSRIIAEQLTLLESEIFDQLELEDLLNFKAASNNPSLMKCVHFFNQLTFWIKTQLLFTDNEKTCHDREKRFLKFLEILKVMKFHQNFSGYTSILYSLIDFPEKFLSKKTRMKFTEESQFMNLSNKKMYLNAIQSAQHPFIPLLAETFSHLTRLNEIMPTFIDNISSGKQSVNFKKMWQHFIIIQYFVVKMHLPPDKKYYQFKVDIDVLAFINDFKDALSESQLFVYKEKLIRSKSKKLYQKQMSSSSDLQNTDL